MSKETFFVCDRCKVSIPLAANQAHTIPDNCSEISVKMYNNAKNLVFPSLYAELCDDCTIGLNNVTREFRYGYSTDNPE